MTPNNVFHKNLIDAYYSCFNYVEAYSLVKNIQKPKRGTTQYNTARRVVYEALTKNQAYCENIEKQLSKKYEKIRDKLVNQLEDVSNTYFILMNLALKDGELNDEEKELFNRLKSIITTKDLNNSANTIAKLTGAFNPKKVEVSNKYKVTFGNNTQL